MAVLNNDTSKATVLARASNYDTGGTLSNPVTLSQSIANFKWLVIFSRVSGYRYIFVTPSVYVQWLITNQGDNGSNGSTLMQNTIGRYAWCMPISPFNNSGYDSYTFIYGGIGTSTKSTLTRFTFFSTNVSWDSVWGVK